LNGYCRKCILSRSKRSRAKRANYKLHVWTCGRRGLEPLSREEHNEITSLACAFGGGQRPRIFVGVDRILASRGYPGNSQPCCAFHNNLKGVMDDDLFRIFLKRHPEHQSCSNSRVIHKSRRPKETKMARETCFCGEDLNYNGECPQGSITGGHQGNCVICGKNVLLDGMRSCSEECDVIAETRMAILED